MNSSLLLACGSVALAVAAAEACAASGNNDETLPPPDAGGSVTPDASASAVDAGDDASVDGQICSKAGWCVTALPDTDLAMKDIWPLSGRAFAVAESPTLGVKVLEWSDAEAKWKYIDDSTQNDSGLGLWVGKIWVPNENEVYYGVSPGYVYHGTRPVPPATAWSWTRHRLGTSSSTDPNDGNPSYFAMDGAARTPALGVWGTSSNDVYAWFKNTIYHWKSVDGSAPEWAAEYVAADVDNALQRLFFHAAAGTGPDDVWFSGARSLVSNTSCALVVRKTTEGYRRVADGVISGLSCTARAKTLMIGGAAGWLTDLQVLAPNELVGLKGARDVVRISMEGDSYSTAFARVPITVSPKGLNSLSTVTDDLWLGGAGLVVRGTGVWGDGAYELSTISLNGGSLSLPIYQVRGTSNTNLWAIGVRYALHKTTP